jgi:hypothetical protein
MAQTTPTTKRPPFSKHRCAACNRRLREGQWIFSRHTRQRYCLPGPKGCNK